MSIRWTRTSVRSFVWNLTRSLFHFTSLFKFPVARVVGTKPTPAEPRATPASAPKTAAPTIAHSTSSSNEIRASVPPLLLISIAWSARRWRSDSNERRHVDRRLYRNARSPDHFLWALDNDDGRNSDGSLAGRSSPNPTSRDGHNRLWYWCHDPVRRGARHRRAGRIGQRTRNCNVFLRRKDRRLFGEKMTWTYLCISGPRVTRRQPTNGSE